MEAYAVYMLVWGACNNYPLRHRKKERGMASL